MSKYWSKLHCLKVGVGHFEHKFEEGRGLSTDEFWRQKTRFPGLSRGVVCLFLRLTVLIQYRRVTHTHTHTHTQTDRQTHGHAMIVITLLSVRVKTVPGYVLQITRPNGDDQLMMMRAVNVQHSLVNITIIHSLIGKCTTNTSLHS